MSIQRWDVVNYQDLFPSEDGEFCDYAEYEKLQQQVEALTAKVEARSSLLAELLAADEVELLEDAELWERVKVLATAQQEGE